MANEDERTAGGGARARPSTSALRSPRGVLVRPQERGAGGATTYEKVFHGKTHVFFFFFLCVSPPLVKSLYISRLLRLTPASADDLLTKRHFFPKAKRHASR